MLTFSPALRRSWTVQEFSAFANRRAYFCCDQPGDPKSPDQMSDTLHVSQAKVDVFAI